MSAGTKEAREGLGEDARILLRLIGTSTRLQFTTGEVLALHPRHLQAPAAGALGAGGGPAAGAGAQAPGSQRACVAMSEEEVTGALDELSRPRGWLGSFTPGRYVFRAFTPGLREDACNPDRPARVAPQGAGPGQ